MRTLLNPLMMANSFEKLFATPGTHTLTLLPGRYRLVMRGGGGAGGQSIKFNGGAGGYGQLSSRDIVLDNAQNVSIIVGAGGKTYANGGNGGRGGYGGQHQAWGTAPGAGRDGGGGGGGGMPSYMLLEASTLVTRYFGWKYAPTTSGRYTGPSKTLYVTYDTPETIYISDTQRTYTWGVFAMINGQTYTNGQEMFYKQGYPDDDDDDDPDEVPEPTPVVVNYYGWQHAPVNSGKYIGPTKTYYVTYDTPQTLYISETPMENTWGTFVLTNGQTYADGEQVFYASDSATVRVRISIDDGVVSLTGTLTNAFGATIVPITVDGFIGGTILTKTLTPAVGDAVYNSSFENQGTITSVVDNTFVYGGNTYSRYNNIDTSQEIMPTIRISLAMSNGSVSLVGAAITEYTSSVVSMDLTDGFIGGAVLTQNAAPVAGDTVYNSSLYAVGTITSAADGTFVYNGNTYSRYANIDTQQESHIASQVFYTLGGGGGGGCGGAAAQGRYASGGGGGGGGGYYRFNTNTNTPVSVPGQAGAGGAPGRSYSNGANGTNGNTGEFPSVKSSAGVGGRRTGGGAGASGGGASGGGGGEAGNHGSGWGAEGGGGGGGDNDAGGGASKSGYYGSNHHTTPTSVAAANAAAGVAGDYGIGGGPNANGASGFVYIKRVGWV